jgi:hypothetical protein
VQPYKNNLWLTLKVYILGFLPVIDFLVFFGRLSFQAPTTIIALILHFCQKNPPIFSVLHNKCGRFYKKPIFQTAV